MEMEKLGTLNYRFLNVRPSAKRARQIDIAKQPKAWLAKPGTWLLEKLPKGSKRTPIDLASLFDYVMLHELTHAIPTQGNVKPTRDWPDPSKCYGESPIL